MGRDSKRHQKVIPVFTSFVIYWLFQGYPLSLILIPTLTCLKYEFEESLKEV